MEGPRGVRAEDLPSLRALTDRVMREGLVDQYVQLFNADNYENLRVCVQDGKCVSHVGLAERGAALFGCPIQVGCIGGVCTLPEYRKQGHASACFDDALRKAREDGIDLMIVSGDRNLYRMRGCVHAGSDLAFTLTQSALPSSLKAKNSDITSEIMTEGELPLVMDCYRAEPVRFVRPPDDYQYALQSGYVMNRPSDFLVIRESGAFRGYVIAPRQGKDGSLHLSEFAGDRHVLLASMPEIMQRYDVDSLGFQVLRHDSMMRSLCEQAGLQGIPRTTPGTVTLINFPQLMQRMHSYLVERLGAHRAAQLRFQQDGERYVFALGNEDFITDRADATRLLFGVPDTQPQILQTIPGALGEALKAVLPLPTLWYGVNYV